MQFIMHYHGNFSHFFQCSREHKRLKRDPGCSVGKGCCCCTSISSRSRPLFLVFLILTLDSSIQSCVKQTTDEAKRSKQTTPKQSPPFFTLAAAFTALFGLEICASQFSQYWCAPLPGIAFFFHKSIKSTALLGVDRAASLHCPCPVL